MDRQGEAQVKLMIVDLDAFVPQVEGALQAWWPAAAVTVVKS